MSQEEPPIIPPEKTLIRTPLFSFPDWSGKDVGDFRIESVLRTGGMSVVYQGIQKGLERNVAVKVLPPALSQDENFQKLFAQEAQTLANLSHPNIVPVYSCGQFEGCPYFAMELIHGETLREKILRRQRFFFRSKTLFSVPDILRWIRQIGAALEYAHGKGVIHRDIKPSNIILDDRDRVFVMDFGLLRVLQLSRGKDAPCGTPAYMSYEQASGGDVDARSDIYAVGCVLYELLTGKPVSKANSVEEAMTTLEKQDLVEPSSVVASVPVLLDEIVRKALQKNPKDRYQSMGEFMAVLERFASGELQARMDPRLRGAKATRKKIAGRRNSKAVQVAILIAIVCATGLFLAKPWVQKWQQAKRQEADAWCISQWQVAQNYRKNQMKELAVSTYRKIIDRYPKHPAAEKAREALKELEEIR